MRSTDGADRDRFETVRVGVTGHRDNRLGNGDVTALRSRIRQVLTSVGRLSDAMTLVSPLAEGADQLAAIEAVSLGYRLECPLPFPREEYVRDFSDADTAETFRKLLAQAAVVEELPGSRSSAKEARAAYAAVGTRMLEGADAVLAIWDGQAARGAGGTAEVVAEARGRGVPVIRIDSTAPHGVTLLHPTARACTRMVDALEALVRAQSVP